MSKRIPLAIGLLVMALAACQPATGVSTTLTKVGKKATPRVVVPRAGAGGGVPPRGPPPRAPPPPATGPGASRAPSAVPSLYRPSRAPDAPIPSGYVSPLPDSAFPSPEPLPSPTPTTSAGPTPVPTPTPTLLDAVVVSNSLPYGNGELTGYVVEPIPGQVDAYRPVEGVTVAITAVEDTTKKALLKNASNGTYKLPEVALGAYDVRVEKSGYASDSAPTTVRIYPGYQSGHTVFLILKQ